MLVRVTKPKNINDIHGGHMFNAMIISSSLTEPLHLIRDPH